MVMVMVIVVMVMSNQETVRGSLVLVLRVKVV